MKSSKVVAMGGGVVVGIRSGRDLMDHFIGTIRREGGSWKGDLRESLAFCLL